MVGMRLDSEKHLFHGSALREVGILAAYLKSFGVEHTAPALKCSVCNSDFDVQRNIMILGKPNSEWRCDHQKKTFGGLHAQYLPN